MSMKMNRMFRLQCLAGAVRAIDSDLAESIGFAPQYLSDQDLSTPCLYLERALQAPDVETEMHGDADCIDSLTHFLQGNTFVRSLVVPVAYGYHDEVLERISQRSPANLVHLHISTLPSYETGHFTGNGGLPGICEMITHEEAPLRSLSLDNIALNERECEMLAIALGKAIALEALSLYEVSDELADVLKGNFHITGLEIGDQYYGLAKCISGCNRRWKALHAFLKEDHSSIGDCLLPVMLALFGRNDEHDLMYFLCHQRAWVLK